MKDPDRRTFLKASLAFGAVTGWSTLASPDTRNDPISSTSQSVKDLVAPSLDEVRVGLIGVGERGTGFVHHFCNIDGATVTAICDIDQEVLDRATGIVSNLGNPRPTIYTGDDYAYRGLLEQNNVDIVVISTPWRWHAIMSVEAMESGKHAFVEVPAVATVEEAWHLVDAAERTRKHCMMLENVCYPKRRKTPSFMAGI